MHARAALAADAVRQREPAQQPAAEEVGHARRRVEEVDRVPGRRRVDDDEVVLAGRVDLEQPLHRDVVVTLHEPRGEVRRTAGSRGCGTRSPRRARGAARGRPTTAWCRASRPTARRAARCPRPSAPRRRRGARRLPRPSSPSAVASRRAGSIVSTSTLPPRWTVAPSAAAAATEVLPTPPEPQKTTISFAASSCSSVTALVRLGAARAHSPSSAPRASATMRVTRRPCARTNRYGTYSSGRSTDCRRCSRWVARGAPQRDREPRGVEHVGRARARRARSAARAARARAALRTSPRRRA